MLAGDKPISSPSEDLFGMSSFAVALAKSLLEMSPKEGIAISVEAPWGAGKSSAIALTVRELQITGLTSLGADREELIKLSPDELTKKWSGEEHRKLHIVRFNPWLFSGQENLVRAFFKELEVQVGVKAQSALTKKINKIAGYLPSALGVIGAGIGAVAGGPAGGGIGATAAGKAGEVAAKFLNSDQSLEMLKQELSQELLKADLRIVVIIDDLDRLLPSEMRSVFSLVKSLGDLPNILYLLAFDEKVVHRALQDGVEKVDPDFLEKIVQVSLKLPPPWRNELHQLLFTRLNAVIGDAVPADEDRWRRMLLSVVDPYLETPRDVTRLVNTLQVIWPNVMGDVDLTDLVAITTLQLFEPQVYVLIRDEIEVITHADYRYEDDKEFAKRMEPSFAKKPEIAKKAMALLFPRIAKVWNSFMSDGTYYIIQKEHRRICTKEYHRNYFVFGRDSRMLSRAEVEQIILSANPSAAFGDTLHRLDENQSENSSSRVANLLEQIGEAIYATPLLTPVLLQGLLDHADELVRREDVVWELFARDNRDRLSSIIRLGLDKLDSAKRSKILEVLVSHGAGLETRANAIEDDARKHGLFESNEKKEWEQLFALNEVEIAANSIRKQIVAAFKDGTIWGMPTPVRLMWRWWRMGDKEALKAWLREVIANDVWIVELAENLPSRSYQSGGEGGIRIMWSFKRSIYKDILDVDAMYARLENLAASNSSAADALSRLKEAEVKDQE